MTQNTAPHAPSDITRALANLRNLRRAQAEFNAVSRAYFGAPPRTEAAEREALADLHRAADAQAKAWKALNRR